MIDMHEFDSELHRTAVAQLDRLAGRLSLVSRLSSPHPNPLP
jgi:hypothetical protein